ncbi:hypothetical protein [Streptomyces stelliscabiei]|uniref:Uncharacterized protein n=1 Tax=Streptomyces stelliscabiei TaxID=146820 RepID=A0A8I0TW25_9ACTN|nr:hypothetical protein [Streptomyces stelliscabiei]MBE1602542.1 hypothetical protein [Streptomyces stelliscabiei]MDX2516762.1 hypothetical protein [Streptomyces stelliscabiei]MDX3436773.1 hypothetical protein [Streptomyces stelliscabiei]
MGRRHGRGPGRRRLTARRPPPGDVLGGLQESGRRIAQALAARPDDERPWEALRRAFDVPTRMNEEASEQVLSYLRMLRETPSLRARHHEKQLAGRSWWVSEVAPRLETVPCLPTDTRPGALAALLDRAVGAFGEWRTQLRPGSPRCGGRAGGFTGAGYGSPA